MCIRDSTTTGGVVQDVVISRYGSRSLSIFVQFIREEFRNGWIETWFHLDGWSRSYTLSMRTVRRYVRVEIWWVDCWNEPSELFQSPGDGTGCGTCHFYDCHSEWRSSLLVRSVLRSVQCSVLMLMRTDFLGSRFSSRAARDCKWWRKRCIRVKFCRCGGWTLKK